MSVPRAVLRWFEKQVGRTPIPTLLTVTELAELLRLKPAAVRALARRGESAYYRIGRSLRFTSSDVDAFLARQRRPGRRESPPRGSERSR